MSKAQERTGLTLIDLNKGWGITCTVRKRNAEFEPTLMV